MIWATEPACDVLRDDLVATLSWSIDACDSEIVRELCEFPHSETLRERACSYTETFRERCSVSEVFRERGACMLDNLRDGGSEFSAISEIQSTNVNKNTALT